MIDTRKAVADVRSTVKRIVVIALLVVAAVVTTACTRALDGTPLPAGRAAGYGYGSAPQISEAPATWAASALDPCLLVADAPVEATRPAFATRPHNCALDYNRPNGRADRIVVRVATSFRTTDRAAAVPTTVGGLSAYQARETEGGEHNPPVCRIDIPISATRSIQVETLSSGGDVEPACAEARAAAEPVAAKLANPAALARTSPPTAVGRWHACDLLQVAIGQKREGQQVASSDADQCLVAPANGEPGPGTEVRITGGPDRLEEPGPGDSHINLPMGQALQSSHGSSCRVTFIAERPPNAPSEYAALLMEITQRDTPDPCAGAVEAATKIQNALREPAPQPPAAPERLGFPAGSPDDVMPVACGVYGNTTPETCREPRTAAVPPGATAVLRAGSFGPNAPDVSCSVLREAAAPVIGRVALAAIGESGCVGLAEDGFAVRLSFFDSAPVEAYCTDLEHQPVEIARRTGRVCNPSPSTYNLVLPAVGTVPDVPGVLLIDGLLKHPRGTLSDKPPADEARVRDLTTQIAETAINRFLTS